MKWMLDGGYAREIAAQVTNPSGNDLRVTVLIEPPEGDIIQISLTRSGANWIPQILDPAHRKISITSNIQGSTSTFVPNVTAFGSAAPVGYTSTGGVSYDPTTNKIWVCTNNGLYEYDIGSDTWANRGTDATHGMRVSCSECGIATVNGSVHVLSSDKTRALLWNGSAWSVSQSLSGFQSWYLHSNVAGTEGYLSAYQTTNPYGVYVTSGATWTANNPGHTNANYSACVIPDYDTGLDYISVPLNQSSQGDSPRIYNGATWSDFDLSWTSVFTGHFPTSKSVRPGETTILMGRRIVGSATFDLVKYTPGGGLVAAGALSATQPQKAFHLNSEAYAYPCNTLDRWIYRYDGGSTWTQIIQLTGATGMHNHPVFVGNDVILMGPTGLEKVELEVP
jgi:hypothetical protein